MVWFKFFLFGSVWFALLDIISSTCLAYTFVRLAVKEIFKMCFALEYLPHFERVYCTVRFSRLYGQCSLSVHEYWKYQRTGQTCKIRYPLGCTIDRFWRSQHLRCAGHLERMPDSSAVKIMTKWIPSKNTKIRWAVWKKTWEAWVFEQILFMGKFLGTF